MSSRRQDENLIQSRRGVTHTLSSANKIKLSKENVISKSNSKSTLKPKVVKAVGTSKSTEEGNRVAKEIDEKKGTSKPITRKPLGLVPSAAATPRTALTSKPNGLQTVHTTSQATISKSAIKPKIASTPGLKTRIKSTQTPSQATAKSGKSKSTLNVFTPGPSTKSNHKIKVKEDDLDDIEYMPPSIKEKPYRSHFDTSTSNEDDDLFAPNTELHAGLNLLGDILDTLDIDSRGEDHDLSFDLNPTQEDINFDLHQQEDFLFDV